MTPEEIIKKIGKENFQKALKSKNSDELKKLLEEEKIELTPEQMDFIAGGAGFSANDWVDTCDVDHSATCDGSDEKEDDPGTC